MKTEMIDRIVAIKKQEKKVLHSICETKTIRNQTTIVSIIGKNGNSIIEKDYSTDEIVSLLECITEIDSKIINIIDKKLSNEIFLYGKWIDSNLDRSDWKYLNQLMSVYKIVIYDLNREKLDEGGYSYCRMEYLDENNTYRTIISQYPIEYRNIEKLNYKEKGVCKDNGLYYINADVMLDIIYKILPAFYISNIENGLSFINEKDIETKIFPSWFNLVLKYPEGYLDLNGQKSESYKTVIENGVLKNVIGVGDKIILDDVLNKQVGVFGIEALCEYSENNEEYIDVSSEKTSVFFDVQKGNIMIDLYGVYKGRFYEKVAHLSIVDFFNCVIYAGGKTKLYGHIISNILIQML